MPKPAPMPRLASIHRQLRRSSSFRPLPRRKHARHMARTPPRLIVAEVPAGSCADLSLLAGTHVTRTPQNRNDRIIAGR